MGLLGDLFKNRRLDDPVPGTFQVTASSRAPESATSGNVRLMGVVQGEGVPPTSVEHHCLARTSRWPHAGMTLPVLVDRADPTSFKIRWDEVQDGWTGAREQADALARALQGQGGDGASATSRTIDARDVPGLREEVLGLVSSGGSPDAVLDALRAHGIDLPGGAEVDVVAPGGRASDDEDPAARLRRLDGLRDAGLVTDAEYAEQRARILADL